MKLTEKMLHYYANYMSAMGIIVHTLFIFQTYTIVKNHSSKDVSLLGFSIALLSIASWLIYGILKKDKVLIRVNIFGLVVSTVCLVTILVMR
jgi:MtN3 and saliva related transmembrane protein